MFAIADTERLVADQVISTTQAAEIESRSRRAMLLLAMNSLLCAGILLATGGLVFRLRAPLPVALVGCLALGLGAILLRVAGTSLRLFGHAAALIGAGMLAGGAALELITNHPGIAGSSLVLAGIAVSAAAGLAARRAQERIPFMASFLCALGVALHLLGGGLLLEQHAVDGLPRAIAFLYTATLLAGCGWFLDVRLITALAVVPFAQVLDTGTGYFHAAYVFFSPEPTLSILQLSALVAACFLFARRQPERSARHARILAVLAFVVANLCALVGSLWGDLVGETIWGPTPPSVWTDATQEDYRQARQAFRDNALFIPRGVFALLWAAALVAIVIRAAQTHQRGLFNTALTFAVIHGYTQLFESFGDEPLAYVIGGLALIPVAWGMWRADGMLRGAAPTQRQDVTS